MSDSLIDDVEALDLVSMNELQHQLDRSLKELSVERLKVLVDFAAYLADIESESATQELLAITGLLERIQQNQSTSKTEYRNWRNLRSDV
ncbi:hypothetical protein [Leptolyngbya sp. NIES-2104]|uniref:hypothetical protein n=1 Tax=Leptolyngbya sp. NIES-2104 TaxID=1552121 RepID=UPI0006EC9A7D|nr:hypothetical protein [Leptolyngbya sp. NIES-2104]GAP98145.1 hypothetical protein NIES2104_46980 [Leptolyngbya sp. NIES-2104]